MVECVWFADGKRMKGLFSEASLECRTAYKG